MVSRGSVGSATRVAQARRRAGWDFHGVRRTGCRIPSSLLAYHARKGFIERIGREVYRVADFPPAPNEALISVGVAFGDDAVISHESALKLYGVADVSPSQVCLRARRAPSTSTEEVRDRYSISLLRK